MATTYDGRSEPANEAGPTRAGAAPAEARDGPRPPQADATARPDHQAADPAADPPSDTPPPAAGRRRTRGANGCCGRGSWSAWRPAGTP